MFISNREMRVIPRGWMHPEGKALLAAEEYPATPEQQQAWMKEQEENEPPSRDEYMPDVSGLEQADTEVMAYETTSEGSPISPAFPNTRKGRIALVTYCAEHCTTFSDYKADVETWAGILLGKGWAAVHMDGTHEVHTLRTED